MKYDKIFIFIFLFLSTLAFSQSKKQLEEQRTSLLEQIKETKIALDQVRSKKKASLFELELLKKQVETRENLILSINKEVQILGGEIDNSNNAIKDLRQDVDKLQAEYRKMLRIGYRNKNTYSGLIFVLSAKDFNQAFRRFKYLQAYNLQRQDQVRYINNAQASLSQRITQLETELSHKKRLGIEEEVQKGQLKQEQSKKQDVLKSLQQNEKKLLADLKTKEAARNRLNRAIEEIIKREIAESNKKGAPSKTKGTAAPLEMQLTPEAKLLGVNFASNKGRLPWPVARGYISESFGVHAHAVLRGIKTTNNGINIRTPEKEPIRALFDGEVTSAFSVPGMQQVVIIRHGQYLTVYAKLVDINVKKGQKIKALETIGYAFTNPDDQKTEMHLEIWNGTQKLDPLPWLIKK